MHAPLDSEHRWNNFLRDWPALFFFFSNSLPSRRASGWKPSRSMRRTRKRPPCSTCARARSRPATAAARREFPASAADVCSPPRERAQRAGRRSLSLSLSLSKTRFGTAGPRWRPRSAGCSVATTRCDHAVYECVCVFLGRVVFFHSKRTRVELTTNARPQSASRLCVLLRRRARIAVSGDLGRAHLYSGARATERPWHRRARKTARVKKRAQTPRLTRARARACALSLVEAGGESFRLLQNPSADSFKRILFKRILRK